MDYRHLINTMDTYKDMYKHFRHQTGTLLLCCSVAAAVLFFKFNNNGLSRHLINAMDTYKDIYINSLDIKLELYFNAVQLLQQLNS